MATSQVAGAFQTACALSTNRIVRNAVLFRLDPTVYHPPAGPQTYRAVHYLGPFLSRHLLIDCAGETGHDRPLKELLCLFHDLYHRDRDPELDHLEKSRAPKRAVQARLGHPSNFAGTWLHQCLSEGHRVHRGSLLTVMATATSRVHRADGHLLHQIRDLSGVDPDQHRDGRRAHPLSPAGRARGHESLRDPQTPARERLGPQKGRLSGSRPELSDLEAVLVPGEWSLRHPGRATGGHGAGVDGQYIEAVIGPLVGNAKPSTG